MKTRIAINTQLADTQRAFDSVAATYDSPRGNNALIQRMRASMWAVMAQQFSHGDRLLDLGCGTGIDALHFAQLGYTVVATDWSAQMVARAAGRAQDHHLEDRLIARQVGIQELEKLSGAEFDGAFDGIYSNFGPLNCAPDLRQVSQQCARLLKPGGKMVFTVIGRLCPWEVGHYVLRRRFKRALVRYARNITPVNLNSHTVWTRYYFPREFFAAFKPAFDLTHHRAFSLFVPPPYLTGLYDKARPAFNALGWLDDHLGHWPLLRDAGDHFLMILTKR